jgi:predicted transcriptional regulator
MIIEHNDVSSKMLLREYVSLLVQNELIEYEGGQTYRTTENGMRLLQLQNKMDELAPMTYIIDKQARIW